MIRAVRVFLGCGVLQNLSPCCDWWGATFPNPCDHFTGINLQLANRSMAMLKDEGRTVVVRFVVSIHCMKLRAPARKPYQKERSLPNACFSSCYACFKNYRETTQFKFREDSSKYLRLCNQPYRWCSRLSQHFLNFFDIQEGEPFTNMKHSCVFLNVFFSCCLQFLFPQGHSRTNTSPTKRFLGYVLWPPSSICDT